MELIASFTQEEYERWIRTGTKDAVCTQKQSPLETFLLLSLDAQVEIVDDMLHSPCVLIGDQGSCITAELPSWSWALASYYAAHYDQWKARPSREQALLDLEIHGYDKERIMKLSDIFTEDTPLGTKAHNRTWTTHTEELGLPACPHRLEAEVQVAVEKTEDGFQLSAQVLGMRHIPKQKE